MNILLIDNKIKEEIPNSGSRFIYRALGFYFKYFENILSLYINDNKFCKYLLKCILKIKYRKKKVYIVLSRELEECINIKGYIKSIFKDYIFVTEQNNLMTNDYKYIMKSINKKHIDKNNAKCLFIINDFNDDISKKINQYLFEFKKIDILCINGKNLKILSFIDNINKEYGSYIEVLDKIQEKNYNIFLIFVKEYKINAKNSFILNYLNSDLDVESMTYLNYKKHKKYLQKTFDKANLDINRFEKTKLGKLYTHGMNCIDK